MPEGASTPITARFPDDLFEEIGVIARAEGTNASEVIRAGIYRYTSTLRADPALQKRLRKRMDEDREIYERYAPERKV